jgi:hypothetical protein
MLEKIRQRNANSGYHGTSAERAGRILIEGFQDHSQDQAGGFVSESGVFFSPDYETAKHYAKKRAEENGDPRFAVIGAKFPKEKVRDLGGYDVIRIVGKKIGRIAVQEENVEYFDTATTEVNPLRQGDISGLSAEAASILPVAEGQSTDALQNVGRGASKPTLL